MLERSCEIYAAANAVDAYLCTPFPQFCVVTLRGEHGIATKLAWFVFSLALNSSSVSVKLKIMSINGLVLKLKIF